MKRWLVAFVAAAVVVPLVASARHANVVDPNDTRGALDVSLVEVEGNEKPRWKIVTFDRWTAKQVWDKGFALVYFDTFGAERFDYYALVRSVGDGLKGTLYRDRSAKSDYAVAKLEVWRPNRRTVMVKVPLTKLNIGPDRLSYRWYVQTLMTNTNCRRVCFDRAPDEGAVEEPTAEPAPSPSLTVMPSPTSSP